MKFLIKRNRSMMLAVACFCTMLIALIWMRFSHQLENDRTQTIAAAVQRNENLAVALEQYTIRTIHNANALLQMVKMGYEKGRTDLAIEKLLDSNNTDRDFFIGVTVADEHGNIVSSDNSITNGAQINVADRAHFTYHKNNPNSGLFIGKPIFSRTLGKPIIPFSRRINKPDGSFGGTVGVQVEPSTFTRFYAEANQRPNDIISLVAPDGITYARRTGTRDSYGENIIKSPLYRHLKQKGVSSYFAKDAIRGIPTYFSYRRLEEYPIIATVGTSEADILADFQLRARRDRFSVIVITLLVLLFSVMVCWVLQSRKMHLDRIKENENKYRSIFQNSQDAILLALPEGKVIAANAATQQIFLMSLGVLCQKKLCELADSTDLGFKEFFDGSTLKATTNRELCFKRGDGTTFIGEMVASPYQDARGKELCILIIRDITDRKAMDEQMMLEQKRFQRRLTRQVVLAQEKEREVIGRELHDNVNQVLTTVKLYLEMAASNEAARQELIGKSIHHLQQSISEIRNLSRDLSAPTLGTRSLVDSISALLEMVQGAAGLKISFTHDSYRTNLGMDQKIALYRMVQEQLNNVIKHAQATQVWISIGQTFDNTLLIIKDNGRGFDPAAKRAGIGLNNIISRTRMFEGEVQIQSSPGNGCSITISLPLQTESNQEYAFLLNSVENS